MRVIRRPAIALAGALLLTLRPVAAAPVDDGDEAYAAKDYVTAMRILRPLADQGDALAQFDVGQMYMYGWGVPEDKTEGMNWLIGSGDNGYAVAQSVLGSLYFPKDDARSVYWLRRAADQGYAGAQDQLAAMYENGFGVPQDYVEALKWSLLALARYAPSESESRRLATVDRDRREEHMSPMQIAEAERRAREWRPIAFQRTNDDFLRDADIALARKQSATALRLFRSLADQGVAEAQTMLGTMYMTGDGVTADDKEGLKWFRLSAAQGEPGGEFGLGLSYEIAAGVTADPVRAYLWYSLAAESTHPVAKDAADSLGPLAAKMTPDQIAQAKAMAGRCKASNYKNCE